MAFIPNLDSTETKQTSSQIGNNFTWAARVIGKLGVVLSVVIALLSIGAFSVDRATGISVLIGAASTLCLGVFFGVLSEISGALQKLATQDTSAAHQEVQPE